MLNPDSLFVKGLKKRIKEKGGYCPCKLAKIPENKCPCVEYKETGYCCCGLYITDPNSFVEEGEGGV